MLKVILFLLLVPAALRADAPDYQRVALVEHPRLSAYLLVRSFATPADEAFFGFELVNHTTDPVEVGNANIWYRYEVWDAATGEVLWNDQGHGGNTYDLLCRERAIAKRTGAPNPYRLEPGSHRYFRYHSISALGQLGIPDRPLAVRGHVQFELSSAAEHTNTLPEGVAFEFKWVSPDENGLAKMRERLVQTIAKPVEIAGDAILMDRLLKDPRLTKDLTVEQVISGIRIHEHAARAKLIGYLDTHHPTDEQAIALVLQTVDKHDRLILYGLAAGGTHIRDARLIDPLVASLRSSGEDSTWTRAALVILARHRELMVDREATIAELGRIVLARSRWFGPNAPDPAAGDKWYLWVNEVNNLVLTGDKGLIPVIAPGLDRREIAVDESMIAVVNNHVSTRVCDVAFNAIMELSGSPPDLFSPRDLSVNDVKAEYARRDELIADLRHRIGSRKAAGEP